MSTSPENKPVLAGDSRLAGVLHLLGLINLFAWPVGLIIQLVMWLTAEKDDKLVDAHGRSAMNFNISVLIYSLVGVVLTFLTAGIFIFAFIPLLLVLMVIQIVGAIGGSAAAKRGEDYRYPLSFNFL